ncbi:MAG: hypothetical protein LQ352_002280 [Teloschistes flavicans]|nr:MAG: hypothetical protein LQ352_002280 [Teloschistes flavicans]
MKISSPLLVAFPALLALNPVIGLPQFGIISAITQASSTGLSIGGCKDCTGINKKGYIPDCQSASPDTLADIRRQVDAIPIGTVFSPGQAIACGAINTDICAALCKNTNTPSVTVVAATDGKGTNIGAVLGDLQFIGATTCGTAPLIRTKPDGSTPGPNDLSTGCISVDKIK